MRQIPTSPVKSTLVAMGGQRHGPSRRAKSNQMFVFPFWEWKITELSSSRYTCCARLGGNYVQIHCCRHRQLSPFGGAGSRNRSIAFAHIPGRFRSWSYSVAQRAPGKHSLLHHRLDFLRVAVRALRAWRFFAQRWTACSLVLFDRGTHGNHCHHP